MHLLTLRRPCCLTDSILQLTLYSHYSDCHHHYIDRHNMHYVRIIVLLVCTVKKSSHLEVGEVCWAQSCAVRLNQDWWSPEKACLLGVMRSSDQTVTVTGYLLSSTAVRSSNTYIAHAHIHTHDKPHSYTLTDLSCPLL